MADTKIFIGPRIRRIRTGLNLTQTAMAEQLGISASYLNLIERNQRPLTAQLVMKLVSTFEIDVTDLQPGSEDGGVAALKEVFADPLLAGELPGDTELVELSDGAPNAATAVVKLYRAYREQQERLSDLSRMMGEGGSVEESEQAQLPVDAVNAVLEAVPWCFPALERLADGILQDMQGEDGTPTLGHAERMFAVQRVMLQSYGITTQVLPVETMPVWRKRFDRHTRRLFLSERLTPSQRAELLVQELVLMRHGKELDAELDLLKITGDEARRLARSELARYTALAVLMPYERFLQTAQRVSHDMNILATRFSVVFNQVAQRLVSLQDKSGNRRPGLAFFMLEIDQAGNVLRRIGAKGFPRASFGGACPKLAVHTAFTRPREVMCERVAIQEWHAFLTLCATAPGPRSLAGERPAHTATLLGIADAPATAVIAAQAGKSDKSGPTILMRDEAAGHGIVHAKQLGDVQVVPPIPIGPACRLCERNDCIARSAPPITRPLGLDDLVSGFGPYGLT